MKTRALLLASVMMALAACHKGGTAPEGQGAVRLTITPVWDGQPFDKTQVYFNAADQRVLVQLVKFYLSRATLIGANTEQELFDADLFTLTDGAVSRVSPVEAGTYSELSFGLGLPEDLNHTDISTVPVNDPLGNNSGMYWTWATMYRFMLFEGRFDNDPQATGTLPFQFSWHTGLDTLFRVCEVPCALDVLPNDTADLALHLDLSRFFRSDADTLSLAEGAQFHGEVQLLPLGIRIADMQQGAFRAP